MPRKVEIITKRNEFERLVAPLVGLLLPDVTPHGRFIASNRAHLIADNPKSQVQTLDS